MGPEPILKPLYSKLNKLLVERNKVPGFFDNKLRRSVSEDGRVHSFKEIETFPSRVYHAVQYGRIFLYFYYCYYRVARNW